MAYRDWGLSRPHDYFLMFGTLVPGYEAPHETVAEAASRCTKLVIGLVQDARQAGKLVLPPEYDKPPQSLRRQLKAWSTSHGYPRAAMHVALVLLARMHGLVSLEISRHLQPVIGDPTELYRSEMLVFLKRLGLKPAPQSSPAAAGST
jgi:hypothetical protein